MINTSHSVVGIFYKKRLTGTLLRKSIEEVSMICHAYTTIAAEPTCFQKEYPPVLVTSCEWFDQDPPAHVQDIRLASPQTHIILCFVQNPLPPMAKLRPLIDTIDPDTFCHISELTACLQTWQSGFSFVSSHKWADTNEKPNDILPGWDMLTVSERRVLALLVKGLSGPAIADILCISESTMNNHKAKIAQKLNVRGGPGSLVRFIVNNHQNLASLFNK